MSGLYDCYSLVKRWFVPIVVSIAGDGEVHWSADASSRCAARRGLYVSSGIGHACYRQGRGYIRNSLA